MSDKPNCYECEYRGKVAGSAHSKCVHPDAKINKPIEELFSMLGGPSILDIPQSVSAAVNMGVKGKKHGILKGWFNWPYNFDPVWLMSCNGFTGKIKEKEL